MIILGIDIGGTKTAACVGDEHGTVRAARRTPTRATEGPEAGLQRATELALDVLRAARLEPSDLDAVGISAPGPVALSGGLMLNPPNMPGWVDVPLVETFRKTFGRPVFMNNDANAAVLAEWLFGPYRGADHLVYFTLSTGLGAGIIAEGRLVQGASDTGGEIGHHVLDPEGPPCPCGQRGCFEVYCGGKNVAERLRARIRNEGISTAIVEQAGGSVDAIDFQAFLGAVRARDAFALQEWDRFLERLAQGTGTTMMFLNPEAIVMGTIAVHAGERLMGPLRERVKKYAWEMNRNACAIAPSTLGEQVGNLGALAVAITGQVGAI